MERVAVDTSAIYALLDRGDRNHTAAVAAFRELGRKRVPIFVTNFIVAECHALILVRLGAELAREWLASLCWPIERVGEADENRAREIIATYTDKSFSYTDATTFAVMERLGVSRALAYDSHFTQYGLTVMGW